MRGAVPDSTALGRNEGTAEFGNISTIDESPLKAGVLAVGTDDGLIQVTRDGGKTLDEDGHFPGVPDTTYREPRGVVERESKARSTRRSTDTAATTSSRT